MPPRSTAMVVYKYIMWHIMPWICAYITLCLYDIWICIIWAISLAITIIVVWEIDRACISIICVRHPQQRAGIAIACPVDSLAHRATASCTPIEHPPSWQPGPSGNRQLNAHCAPAQLPAWPIGLPPAERPLCTRPAASLAHRATASCTTIVHPPSCQPGPSGNRQLHDHSAPPAASLAHRATASCTPSSHPLCNHPAASWTLSQPLGSPSVHTPAPPSPVPSNLWLISPFPPHHRWRRNQDASV